MNFVLSMYSGSIFHANFCDRSAKKVYLPLLNLKKYTLPIFTTITYVSYDMLSQYFEACCGSINKAKTFLTPERKKKILGMLELFYLKKYTLTKQVSCNLPSHYFEASFCSINIAKIFLWLRYKKA